MTAQSRVERWCAFYTRGISGEVASERREELAADVLDHTEWAAEQGISHSAVERAITWRAVKGVRSDLAWRRTQLMAAEGWRAPLASAVANDTEMLALIEQLPSIKRQPNLVFAAARFLGAPVGPFTLFREWLIANWADATTICQHTDSARDTHGRLVRSRLCRVVCAERKRVGREPRIAGDTPSPARLRTIRRAPLRRILNRTQPTWCGRCSRRSRTGRYRVWPTARRLG